MSFEAWHGSKSGYCGFMEGYREVDVAWFSFYRGEAEEFARQAWNEGYLPTLCRVSVEGSRYSLFDANSDLDEDGERDLLECLKRKGVSDGSIPYILSGILNYDFTAFDPDGGGTDSVQVAECIRDLGYIGWLERESHNDDPGNFGLFDPARNVTVLEEIKLCPERGTEMEKIGDNTYECGCCDACGIYKTCEFCGLALEFDEDDDDWIYPCNCDLQMRQNPMTTVADLKGRIRDSSLSDYKTFESAQSHYAKSFRDPDGYLEDHPVDAGYRYMHGRNYIFVGPKGRMLKVYAEDLQPAEGNIFYADKLKGLAVAPKFVDFKIPLYVGYVDPWEMDEQMYQEAIDYADEFYEPDEDDIGEVYLKLQDGNHRTLGALLSGEPYAYVQISNSAYQDYENWIAAGRPDEDEWPWTSPAVLAYLDRNLV